MALSGDLQAVLRFEGSLKKWVYIQIMLQKWIYSKKKLGKFCGLQLLSYLCALTLREK